MNCKNCGAEIEPNQKFCQVCGSKIEQVAEPVNPNPITETKTNAGPINVTQNQNTSNNAQNNQNTKPAEKGKGLKIASLVIGIISLVFCILNVLILPLAIIGLILGIVYSVKNKKASAGLIINIIAIVLSIVIFILGVVLLGMLGAKIEEMAESGTFEEFLTKLEESLEENGITVDDDYDYDYGYDDDDDYSYNKSPVTINTTTKDDKYKTGYKYVGSDKYGYIKVPNNWGKFYDVDGNDTLQYSYGQTWIVTLYSTTEPKSKYDYANAVYEKLKSDNVKNLEMKFDFIGEEITIAYKISCYYPSENKYLSTWFFEGDDDRVYYLAIEGPDKDSEYFELVDTFVFKK